MNIPLKNLKHRQNSFQKSMFQTDKYHSLCLIMRLFLAINNQDYEKG